jgi:hypothetical protein
VLELQLRRGVMVLVTGNKACRSVGLLADGAHEPVLYISKNKTVNCHMQAVSGKPVTSPLSRVKNLILVLN